jgi:hypothetical protein
MAAAKQNLAPAPVNARIVALSLPGDWKVPRTRRQECRRYVAQAFQPAGPGDFPVACASAIHPHYQEQSQDAPPVNSGGQTTLTELGG